MNPKMTLFSRTILRKQWLHGTEVGVLEEPHEEGLTDLLESHHSRALEANVGLEVLDFDFNCLYLYK